MSVDIELLKRHGISSGEYRKIFSAHPTEYPKPVRQLVDLISTRIKDGRVRNFRDWRTYAAIDYAYEVPFNQITPTLIQHIFSQNLTPEQTLSAVQSWGLKEDDLFLKIEGPDGKQNLLPNPPVFYQILIPIVRAYITIREAKLFNERNTEPLLPYLPLKETSRNRVLCEIVTDLINTISNNYNYSAVLRQAIHQTLKYGWVIAFPEEEWHSEKQLRTGADGSDQEIIVKEGLRYMLPHPTRTIYDTRRPATRINSDTGCDWAGTWYLRSYGDVLDSKMFWNRKAIFRGTNWFDAKVSGSYFSEFFPCGPLKLLTHNYGFPLKREDAASYYTSNNRDQAVFMTEFFMKLIPRDWGLGAYKNGKIVKTYDHPVWHRFTVAGDHTVLWAAPCAYNPMWFMGYDYDEQCAQQSSLGLETIPWQDHIGNILSQIILTSKQNLANVHFYDTNVLDEKDILTIKNLGETRYRSLNFVGYDSQLLARKSVGSATGEKVVIPVRLDKQSIVEMLQMLPMVLSIMERVLQVSAQESGAAASHQQSKEEVVMTGNAATNRVAHIGSQVDEGIDAWKRQLNDAAHAYKDPGILAEVSADIPNLKQHLEDLGFSVVDQGKGTFFVAGKKPAIRLESFSATKKGADPSREKEMAQIIFQVVGTVAAQAPLVEKVGVDNLLALLEQAARFGGAPADFKLDTIPAQPGAGGVTPAVQQAIQHAIQAVMEQVGEQVVKPISEKIGQMDQKQGSQDALLEKLQQIYKIAAETQDKNALAAQKTQADIQRKDAEAAARIKRDDAKTSAEIHQSEMRAQADVAIKGAQAAHGAAVAGAKK